jgi:putative oxidoreductase
MLYDGTALDTAGRLLIVLSFLVSGVFNLKPVAIKQHIERLKGFGVPFPLLAFWIGMALQFGGVALLITGWHAEIGVYFLIVFTVLATGLYHRFWTKPDPAQRTASRMTVVSNTAILGGLLLLLQNLR